MKIVSEIERSVFKPFGGRSARLRSAEAGRAWFLDESMGVAKFQSLAEVSARLPHWGIVKLPNAAREEAEIPLRGLRGVAEFGDLAPCDHRLGTKRSIVG